MYYIDFDNTLFNTHKYGIELVSNLHEKALQYLAPDSTDIDKVEIINNPTIEYYFSKATELSQKYNISYEALEKALQDILTKETIKYKPILNKYNISYKTLDQLLFEKFTTNITTEELSKKYNIPNEIVLDELITATKTDTSNYTKILGHLYETAIQLISISKEDNHNESIENNNSNSSIANFFLMAQNLSTKYNIPYDILEKELIDTMKNDSKFTFDDTIKFLKSLRSSGEKICILTHVSLQKDYINSDNSFLQSNLAQQIFKLAGSGVLEFVDEVYITTLRKYQLDLDYKHNNFIDDDPKDLKGLLYTQNIPINEKLNLQYINFNDLYNTQKYYEQTMEMFIDKIVQETSISYEEVKKQINFDLNSPNFEIIIDCLSAKFHIRKQILRNVVESTLQQQSITAEQPIQQVEEDNSINIITAYGVKPTNIKQQLLLIAYSGKLPLAKGIFITDQNSVSKEPSSKKGTITRIKKNFDYKRISSSISDPFTGIQQEAYKELPSPENIPTYTNLTYIPIQTFNRLK